ncbi:MAG: Hsp20/alpha crystallin family protein [Hyphomicrobiales bacterium]|nr:Hsp20/alpha crystallin family protein [Hyphomicrobiales bacterium]MCP4998680.1 Hsp20/alpha crystallin family protein [Hyphomicrobiales bacterium]
MRRSFLPSVFGDEKDTQSAFHSLHNEIDRVFDDFRGWVSRFDAEPLQTKNGMIIPKLDVSEKDDTVEITAELPGVKEEDIDVSITSNVLTLKGEKSVSKEEKEKDYSLVERSYGSFARSLPMAFDIDPDGVSAKFTNGILTITIKKPPEIAEKTKKIEVTKAD